MKKWVAVSFLICAALLCTSDLLAGYSGSVLSFLKGYRAEIRGRYDEAMEFYSEALREDPGSADVRTELALLYIKKGDLHKAEGLLKEAIAINGKSRSALILLASLYSATNELNKAKPLYEKCIEMDDEDTEAYLYLSSIYITEKKYTEAMKIYEKILSYDDDSILTLYYAGTLKAEMKDYDGARKYLNRVIELKPNYEPALLAIGAVFEAEGSFDRAIEQYQKMLLSDPGTKRRVRG